MAVEITTEISPSGETKVSVKGVKGKSCKALTADFERGLGKVTHDVPTKEMHENEVQTVRNRA